MIDNPQVKRICNEVLRPVADQLARMVYLADSTMQQVLDPEFLEPLGITVGQIAAEVLPTITDEQIDDGRASEGIPLATRLKALKLIRVIAQFDALCKATQYSTPEYVKVVAFDLAVNPRG